MKLYSFYGDYDFRPPTTSSVSMLGRVRFDRLHTTIQWRCSVQAVRNSAGWRHTSCGFPLTVSNACSPCHATTVPDKWWEEPKERTMGTVTMHNGKEIFSALTHRWEENINQERLCFVRKQGKWLWVKKAPLGDSSHRQIKRHRRNRASDGDSVLWFKEIMFY